MSERDGGPRTHQGKQEQVREGLTGSAYVFVEHIDNSGKTTEDVRRTDNDG